MKDLSSLMKQAQAMQEKMGQAQKELEQMVLLGQAGDGMVKLTLRGSGEIAKIDIDDSLMVPGEADMVGDLVAAAHADAKRQLDQRSGELMQKAAGPLANMPGMPKF